MSETENVPGLECFRRWFGTRSVEFRPLSGGLSGATAWAVEHGGRRFVLKCFAASASRDHVAWLHALMRHVRLAGVPQVPSVEAAADGETVHVDDAGTRWEVLAWMPGRATAEPSARQVAAAAETLARVHRAAATMPGASPRRDHSPGVLHRIARARDLLRRPWAARLGATFHGPLHERFERAVAVVAAAGGERAMARAAEHESRSVAVQPVLRDVWHAHLLFEGEQLTGLIDWHAAGVDTPATDIARLVGSWPQDPMIMRTFLDAYAAVRPLEEELALIPYLRDTGVLFGFDNWFRWIVEENRPFADTHLVQMRVDALLAALPGAVHRLAFGISPGDLERGVGLD